MKTLRAIRKMKAFLKLMVSRKKKLTAKIIPDYRYKDSVFPYRMHVAVLHPNGHLYARAEHIIDDILDEKYFTDRHIDPKSVTSYCTFDTLFIDHIKYGTPKGVFIKTLHNVVLLSKTEV